MRKTLLGTSAASLLAAASASHGAIVVTFIPRGTPQGSATQTSTGYVAYTIRLTETTGANITAVDMESGTNGLFGKFVQRWSDTDGDGTYGPDSPEWTINAAVTQNLSPNANNNHPHLLLLGTPPADANYVGKINFDESVGGATFLPDGSPNPPFPNNGATGIAVSTDF